MKRIRKGIVVAAALFLFLTIHSNALSETGSSAVNAGPSNVERSNAEISRPVVLTTDEQIERARLRVAERVQPFYKVWTQVLKAADEALGKNYVPNQHEHHEEYFNLARLHAQDVRNLAIVYLITEDQRYLDKARRILVDWAEDALESPHHPSAGSPHSAGLVIGRVMSIFTDGYAMLWPELDEEDRERIEAWFRKSLEPIRESREIWETAEETCSYGECTWRGAPWLDHQNFNNHLGAQNLGIVAIGFALRDEEVIEEGMRDPRNPRNLETLLSGTILMDNEDAFYRDSTFTQGYPDVQPGEIFDRYRISSGRGLHYSHIHLRFLTLQAEMAFNNGYPVDWYEYTGNKGQNLELPFTFYSEFLISGNADSRGGYYRNDAIDYGLLPLYEIAYHHYPYNAQIRQVLEGSGRLEFDVETFGWTLMLTHGADVIGASPDSIWKLALKYAKLDEVSHSLLSLLENKLNAAEKMKSEGKDAQAAKHVEDLFKHFERAERTSQMSTAAKEALEAEVQALLDRWNCQDCDDDDGGVHHYDWQFNNGTDAEGWRTRKSVKLEVSDGMLHLEVTGSDPGILSPHLLDIDADRYKTLIIRKRNETDDHRANVFFVTDADPNFDGEKVVFYDIEPMDEHVTEYVIDMSSNPHWQGRIERLRIDPVHSARSGFVHIDSIRLTE